MPCLPASRPSATVARFLSTSRFMRCVPCLPLALALACTAPPPAPATPTRAAPPIAAPTAPTTPTTPTTPAPALPTPPAVPLVLELTAPNDARAESGSSPRFTAQLRNTGTTAQKAVQSGDGSIGGVREPYLRWSGEYDPGDGDWRPMTTKVTPGCGMYDENWHDEIVTIAAGNSAPLGEWLGAPDYFYDTSAPGRYRVQLHYAYTAGRREPERFAPGDMAGVAPFELVSAPVEFTVFRPLELVLKRRPGAKPPRRLSDVVEAKLVSKSAEAKQLPPLTGAELQLLGPGATPTTTLSMAFKPAKKRVYVPAGATLDVLGLADLDWSPALDAPGTRVRLRLVFTDEAYGGQTGPQSELLSDPFTLTP